MLQRAGQWLSRCHLTGAGVRPPPLIVDPLVTMGFFRDNDAFCVRAEMSVEGVTLKLILETERVADPNVRQVPYWPESKPTPAERVRDAVLAGAEAANRSCGTSFWPLAIEFQLEREYSAPQTLERFTREIIERLARYGPQGFEGSADGDAR